MHVSWGTFALVEATRALMRASLEDPLNQKVVLLSEAGIPLYPPDLFYVQLMSEDKSRINSCITPGVCLCIPYQNLLCLVVYPVSFLLGASLMCAVWLWLQAIAWPCTGWHMLWREK